MRTTPLLFAIALLGAACSNSAEGTGGDAVPSALPSAPPPMVDVRDGNVHELAVQLSTALGKSVTVDAEAMALARCARITLVVPAHTTPAQLVAVAGEALAGVALELGDAGGHYVVRRVEGAAIPPSCERYVSPARPDGGGDPRLDELGDRPVEGIRQLAENRFEVDANAPAFAGGAEAFMRVARFVPHTTAGDPDGLRVFGLRRRGVAGALGLKNGDIVKRVAGRPISTPASALELAPLLSTANEFEVDIERDSKPLKLTYVIVRGASSSGRAAPRESPRAPRRPGIKIEGSL